MFIVQNATIPNWHRLHNSWSFISKMRKTFFKRYYFLGNVSGIIYWTFLEELPQLRSRPRLSSPPITSKRPAKRTSSAWWGSAVFWPKIVLTVSWKSMTSLTSKASFYIYASVIARKEGIWTTVLQSNLRFSLDLEHCILISFTFRIFSVAE